MTVDPGRLPRLAAALERIHDLDVDDVPAADVYQAPARPDPLVTAIAAALERGAADLPLNLPPSDAFALARAVARDLDVLEHFRPPVTSPTVPTGKRETSRKAAARLAPRVGTIKARILAHVRDQGPVGATDDELEVILGLKHQTASSTRWSLMDAGWVADSGLRRPTRGGDDATVWVTR